MHDFLECIVLAVEFTQISQSLGSFAHIECVVIFYDRCGVLINIGWFLYSDVIYSMVIVFQLVGIGETGSIRKYKQ